MAATHAPQAAARERVDGATVKKTATLEAFTITVEDATGGPVISGSGLQGRVSPGQLAHDPRAGRYYTLEDGLLDALDVLAGGEP